jgi:hypothetical protein
VPTPSESLPHLRRAARKETSQPASFAVADEGEALVQLDRSAKGLILAEADPQQNLSPSALRQSNRHPTDATAVSPSVLAVRTESSGSEPRSRQSAVAAATAVAEADLAAQLDEEMRAESPSARAPAQRSHARHPVLPAAEPDERFASTERASATPVIRVNIGRVELRMAAAPKVAPAASQPRLALRDFLKQQ